MTENIRLSDAAGVIALDANDYSEQEHRQTTLSVDLLRDATEIIDRLGWTEVDVLTVDPANPDSPTQPALLLRPPEGALFAKHQQAGLLVAARTPPGGDDE